jgi:hypothetical protein
MCSLSYFYELATRFIDFGLKDALSERDGPVRISDLEIQIAALDRGRAEMLAKMALAPPYLTYIATEISPALLPFDHKSLAVL